MICLTWSYAYSKELKIGVVIATDDRRFGTKIFRDVDSEFRPPDKIEIEPTPLEISSTLFDSDHLIDSLQRLAFRSIQEIIDGARR